MSKETCVPDIDWVRNNVSTQDELVELLSGYSETTIKDFLTPALFEIFFDDNGQVIDKRETKKDWKYFSRTSQDLGFYIEKAKYILRNYSANKKMLENYREYPDAELTACRRINRMSEAKFKQILADIRFLDRLVCSGELAEWYVELYSICICKMSYRNFEQTSGLNRGSIENNIKNGIKRFAELLMERDHNRELGEAAIVKQIIKNGKLPAEISMRERSELIGQLVKSLKRQIEILKCS